MGQIKVIALSGRAGSGKDYIHEHFLRTRKYHRWALADHFKVSIAGRGGATYEEVFTTKPPHVRKLLQEEGTERGRLVYGESVWLDTAFTWLEHLSNTWGITKFCITDARFPNEVEYIQNRGGKVFRIEAPTRVAESSLNAEARQHISETALDDYTGFDGYISNDPEDEPLVGDAIKRLLHQNGLI
jgi:hypothetical protein